MFLAKKPRKFQSTPRQMSPTPTQISVGYWLICGVWAFLGPLSRRLSQFLRLLCFITHRKGTIRYPSTNRNV